MPHAATPAVEDAPPPLREELNAYRRRVQSYDEMFGLDGELDSLWSKVASMFLNLSEEDKQELIDATRRSIREHGITYSVHGDPQKAPRPWQLDLVPLVMAEEDWNATENGLQQRAELLDAILKDLYGHHQVLFKEGLLPPDLIFRHPGYLQACRGFEPLGGRRLIMYGTDLARGPDGRMWVINDRTQAPSGAGYAIENRVIIARILPALFKECGVRRLAPPFRRYRDYLYNLVRVERREPRVVLLTPGPFNETYFEHAYLAAYLGIDLVQGHDLTVRDAHVWLKTLAGLEPVDVIVRRVDELWCDPLELRTDSQLGVAGLVEAARRGNVAIANPLGNGVLENPALLAFLPGICKFLRKEELLLPSAATWWCGHKKERAYVLENLSKLVVKSINRAPHYGTVFGPQLSSQELSQLKARIEADPYSFVGQELVSFASAPAMIDGKLEPRRNILRSVVTANGDNSYDIMPGGLTLSNMREEGLAVSYSRGGIAKDTWVAGPASEEQHQSLWSDRPRQAEAIGPHHLSSRAGENLFWVGRYAERAEAVARVLRRVLRIYFQNEDDALLASDAKLFAELQPGLEKLTSISGEKEEISKDKDPEREKKRVRIPMETYLASVISSTEMGSLHGNLRSLLGSAYAVRDLWSPDSWRVIGQIEQSDSKLADTDLPFASVALEVNSLILHLVAFSGLNLESMTRDAGWVLLEIGRRLERSVALVTLVEAFMLRWREGNLSAFRMESLLAASDSLVTHRRRYRSEPRAASVLELLLMDENNPRSLIYQLLQMQEQIRHLPGPVQTQMTAEAKLVLREITDLRLGELDDLVAHDPGSNTRIHLGARLARIRRSLLEVSDHLTRKYFIHISANIRG